MTDNLITMVDKELSMLPSTGSRGAMSLPMIGLGMMLGGVIVVLSGKKKNCT
ncbi:MAG: LPXTG cell wall anchor domain-containing protein [Eubacterium sp.]|nr:LPXTG cell wall anchor domain-containing protein [Eubacterium sp.]